MRDCPSCLRAWPEDRFNGRDPECFKCRASSISVTFAGGKQVFHDQTDKQGQERTIREGKMNGLDPVPVGKGTYSGFAGSQASKLASSLTPSVGVSAETTSK